MCHRTIVTGAAPAELHSGNPSALALLTAHEYAVGEMEARATGLGRHINEESICVQVIVTAALEPDSEER